MDIPIYTLDYQTLTPVINILSGIKVDLGGLSLIWL